MDRRDFIVRITVSAAALPLAHALASCGGEGGDGDGSGGDSDLAGDSPPAGDDDLVFVNLTVGSGIGISSNHGHTLTIPGPDIAARTTGKTYMLAGSHSHTLILLDGDFETLRTGGTVTRNAAMNRRRQNGSGFGVRKCISALRPTFEATWRNRQIKNAESPALNR